jgi:hypothetical protein
MRFPDFRTSPNDQPESSKNTAFEPVSPDFLVDLPPGERMILEHSIWLSAALATARPVPRIPTLRVSDGGFARLMTLPAGRYRAERWWEGTLQALGD